MEDPNLPHDPPPPVPDPAPTVPDDEPMQVPEPMPDPDARDDRWPLIG